MPARYRTTILFAALGLAACSDNPTPTAIAPSHSPLATRTPTIAFSLTSITVGHFQSCGLTGSGVAYCWGQNSFGELGIGTTPVVTNVPTPVSGGLTFTSIEAGPGYTCGLIKGGQAYCWGLADGIGRGDAPTDPQLPGAVLGGIAFSSIDAGTSACGLEAHTGYAYCWGFNANGEVGNGTNTPTWVKAPSQVLPPAGATSPVSFISLAAAFGAVCGLTRPGDVYCWGNGAVVGNGPSGHSYVPLLIAGGNVFSSIAAGYSHMCGIIKTGQAVCWGVNTRGQLGDNTTTDSDVPRLVSTTLTFASMTGGNNRTCALTSRGAAYCWGEYVWGALGDGTTIDRHAPTPVVGGISFTSISTHSSGHTCAITDRLGAWCWGVDDAGQLGTGTSIPGVTLTPAPTAVKAP